MNKESGFTLIELMVTVVVIALLASIAIPNYSDYVIRSKLSEAFSELSTMSTKLEQFYQDNRTYVGACETGTVAPLPPKTENFTFDCPTRNATTYLVRAKGNDLTSMAGFEFTLGPNNAQRTTGVRSGWDATGLPKTCWVKNKSGGC